MKLEIKQIAKVTKISPNGLEIEVYKCIMKGGDGVVKSSLTLESPNMKELQYIVNQQIGEVVECSLHSMNHHISDYSESKEKTEG